MTIILEFPYIETTQIFVNLILYPYVYFSLQGVKRTDSQPLIDRFTNRNIDGGLPTLHIQQSTQGSTAPSTPTFANSGQQSREAMMSRVGAISTLGRGAISQSAAAVAAASSTGLKRLFEQAKEGAVKKEGTQTLCYLIICVSSKLFLLLAGTSIVFSPTIINLLQGLINCAICFHSFRRQHIYLLQCMLLI